ncbi:GNAT family N-acetyltransferase [Rhizobium leguminosarum]|uniref:GNAT family N-acetyltransferase n=1 Tax=Rhizobium leguminosarum TaxID=384 RepID=UPI001C954DE7|nr:GNAT family N-acetyltransferase [Rhizobium leguminosarum]MBY5533665.1 GNAT family N-acetyltransferase [Rhizobium leguminosarum]
MLHAKSAPEEVIEARAFLDLFMNAPSKLVNDTGFACALISDGCAISLPAAPAIGLNRIVGLSTLSDIQIAFNWLRRKTGRRFLQINEARVSDDIRTWIQNTGLVKEGVGWAKLVRHASVPVSKYTGPLVVRKATIDDASVFGEIMCVGFNFPRGLSSLWSSIVGKHSWTCLVAELEGRVVGTGAMYVLNGHAWLGGGTTLPEFRNLGVQKALIQGRLKEGISRGVCMFAVETAKPELEDPNISFNNLIKAGFKHTYTRTNFMVP